MRFRYHFHDGHPNQLPPHVEHPNLLRYIGANVKGQDLYVVTEYHRGGDLRHLLQLSEVALGWDVIVKMLLQTSTAIAYLHSLELIHRDIKTQNIILDRNLNIFLCDFGLNWIGLEDLARKFGI